MSNASLVISPLDLAKSVARSVSVPELEASQMQPLIVCLLKIICKYVSHNFKLAGASDIVCDVPVMGWFVKLLSGGGAPGAAPQYRFVPSELMQEATRITAAKDFELSDGNVVRKQLKISKVAEIAQIDSNLAQ